MPKGTKSARKRIQVGLILSAETKTRIEVEAAHTGLTQSQVAEQLIEKALHYDRVVAAMGQSLDDIRRGNLRAALRRAGYTVLRDFKGNEVWFSPGHPQAPPRSGFEPWQPGELEAFGFGTEVIVAPRDVPLTLEQARRNRESWERLLATQANPPTQADNEMLEWLKAIEAALVKKDIEK